MDGKELVQLVTVEELEKEYLGFEKLRSKLEEKGARSPAGLAAYIGRKKYGKEEFAKLGAKGRRKGKKKSEKSAQTGPILYVAL